jgi:hypothetical protein
MTFPVGVCVKVNHLRPEYSDLQDFLSHPENQLVCRSGRVFVTRGATRNVFVYKGSEFANPFRVGQYTRAEALFYYRTYLENILKKDDVKQRFLQLARLERIGCFCEPDEECHRDIIIEKLKELAQELQIDAASSPSSAQTRHQSDEAAAFETSLSAEGSLAAQVSQQSS